MRPPSTLQEIDDVNLIAIPGALTRAGLSAGCGRHHNRSAADFTASFWVIV
jgi:hypothetical protein